MSVAQNASRQEPIVAYQRIKFSDLVSGVAVKPFTRLANGAIPLSLFVVNIVPFNSATSDVLDIGRGAGGNAAAPIAASANAYKNDANLASAAGTRTDATVLPVPVNDASGGLDITVTWTGAGAAPTAGEFLVGLIYAEEGREQFTQG